MDHGDADSKAPASVRRLCGSGFGTACPEAFGASFERNRRQLPMWQGRRQVVFRYSSTVGASLACAAQTPKTRHMRQSVVCSPEAPEGAGGGARMEALRGRHDASPRPPICFLSRRGILQEDGVHPMGRR